MEGCQSTEDEGSKFHTDSQPNNEKGNSMKTSSDEKESLVEKANSLPGSSTEDENSQHLLHSNIEKLHIKCKGNMPKLDKVVFDETVYKSKDNHSRIILSVASDESDSDEKVYFTQVSKPVFYHEDFSEDGANLTLITNPTVSGLESITTELESPLHGIISTVCDEIASETKDSSSGISGVVIPDESVLENKTYSTRSRLEVSDETGLQKKLGSLQISNPVKLDESDSGSNINLLPISSHIIPDEAVSNTSPFSFKGTSFHRNDSINSGSLSFKETKSLFKLPEKSMRNKKEQMKVLRKQRCQLPPKDNQNKAYDFKAFSQVPTDSMQSEWKLNPFEICGTKISEQTVSDTNESLGEISRPMLRDVNVSKSKPKLSDIFKFGVSDETSLENKFSSFRKSRYAGTEKTASDNNSGLFNISRPVTFGDDNSLNSVSRQKTIRCINSILRRDSLHESEWLINSQEASVTKNPRKRKRELRNLHPVTPSETLEIQVKCEDKSTQTSKNLVDDSASGSTSFTFGRNRFGDLDEETLRSIRTLLSDCLSWLSNISETNQRSKDATNQQRELRNLKQSDSPRQFSLGFHKNNEGKKKSKTQTKPPPNSSLRIHQNAERSKDATNQRKQLRNLKFPPSESSPRILQKDKDNLSTTKFSTAVKSNQKAKALQSRLDSDSSKLKAYLPQSHDGSVEHNQNSSNLNRSYSFNRITSSMDKNTISKSTTSGQHQSIFFKLDGKCIEILVSKKLSKTTENEFSNRNAADTREINQSRSSADENINSKNLWHFDSIKRDNSDLNRNTSQSHSSKVDNNNEHGLQIPVSTDIVMSKTSENNSSRKINRNQSWTDSRQTANTDNRNLYHFDSVKESNDKSNRNQPKLPSSKADISEHGLEIKTSTLQASNTVNLAETRTENTNLLPVFNLMISSESGSEMSLLPITGTLIYEDSSRNSENVSSDGPELLFKHPETSIRDIRQKKNVVRKQSHQLVATPNDSQSKAYDFKPFLETNTESTPFEWKLGSLQIPGSTISGEADSNIKDGSDQISISTVPEETISGIKDSLCQISSSTVLDETAQESNENFTYQNSSRNTTSMSPDGAELLFKLPEKSTRDRRRNKSTVRKQSHQLSVTPKDSQNKAYDFKPFSQTYTESTPFQWKLSPFQISGSTIPEETTVDIKESMDHIRISAAPDKTGLSIKDGLNQISNCMVLEEATSDIKGSIGQISSSTVLDETASEGNETYENSSRNTTSMSPDGTELSFKLPEKLRRNIRKGQRNAVRKPKYQLSESPKDSQTKAYDFKPSSQTNADNIPFEWKLSSFGSTIPGETTSDIEDNMGQISRSKVREETTSDIKHSLGQTSSTVIDETAQESNDNFTNKSKPENSNPCTENKLSHHHKSSMNLDKPDSDKNSSLPNTFKPTFSDGDSLNSVVPLNVAALRVMNRNMSQSNSSKLESNKTNNDYYSEWWTLFSINLDESHEIRDVVIAMFLQFLVFTATEYVYEFFNFFFFLLIISIAVAGILCNS